MSQLTTEQFMKRLATLSLQYNAEITFKANLMQMEIWVKGVRSAEMQALPIADHLYGEKVLACIQFMIEHKL